MTMDYLDKGTDTDALGSYWFSAEFEVEEGESVTKVEAVCDGIVVQVQNPISPVIFNLTKEQSRQMSCGQHTAHLYGYDGNGKRFKFKGEYVFTINPEDK